MTQTPETRAPKQRPWTQTDLAYLRANNTLGATHLAELLNRTPTAIRQTAHRHHISLRPPGETRGLVLGQPRATQLPTPIRQAMLNPTTNRQITQDAQAILTGAQLCPLCARWPIHPGRTWCDPCQTAALTTAYELHTARLQAQQAHTAARQRRSRALRNAQNGPPSPPNPQSGPELHPCDSRASQGPSGDSVPGEVPPA